MRTGRKLWRRAGAPSRARFCGARSARDGLVGNAALVRAPRRSRLPAPALRDHDFRIESRASSKH
jgi:hypothetical protein